MLPVFFTFGNFPVSSFGVLLGLGIFFASFTVWRIAKSYEFDSERILDIIFLTIVSGFIVSRLVFALENLPVLNSALKVIALNRYPGFSFWGGFFGGLLVLWLLSKRNKLLFLEVGDFAIVGFFIAAFFTSIGCLLGSCGYGLETNSFLGATQAGIIGKRFPIQAIEALAFLLTFSYFWKAILKFHIQGSIFAKGLIVLGLVKAIAGFFKADTQTWAIANVKLNINLYLSLVLILLGFRVFYQVYKKTPLDDLKLLVRFFSDKNKQKSVMTKIYRGCYNQKVNFWVFLERGKKRLFKFLKLKSNPESF